MIRFILIMIPVILYHIVSIPLLLVLYIVRAINHDAAVRIARGWINFGFIAVRIMSGARVTYIGLENIPQDTPCMFAANHLGFFDIILTFPKIVGKCVLVSKDSLSKVPIFSQLMGLIDCLYVDRSDIKSGLQMILKAIDKIKSGSSVLIFPEGTRSKTGELLEFKEGSFKIATKTGCPIVPIAIKGTNKIFEDRFPRIIPSDVTIEFGQPIAIADKSRDELKFIGRQTHDLIAEMRNNRN